MSPCRMNMVTLYRKELAINADLFTDAGSGAAGRPPDAVGKRCAPNQD